MTVSYTHLDVYKRQGTAKELYRSDLVELIRMHPYTRIQSELDRQDVYEVEISLIDDLDGDTDTYMQTAVTVSGLSLIHISGCYKHQT